MEKKKLRLIFAICAFALNILLVVGFFAAIVKTEMGGGQKFLKLFDYYSFIMKNDDTTLPFIGGVVGFFSLIFVFAGIVTDVVLICLFLLKENDKVRPFMCIFGPCLAVGALAVLIAILDPLTASSVKLGFGGIWFIIIAILALLHYPISRVFLDKERGVKSLVIEGIRFIVAVLFIVVAIVSFKGFFKVKAGATEYQFSAYYVSEYLASEFKGGSGSKNLLKGLLPLVTGGVSLVFAMILPLSTPIGSLPTLKSKRRNEAPNPNKGLLSNCIFSLVIVFIIFLLTIFVGGKDFKISFGPGGILALILLGSSIVLSIVPFVLEKKN